MNKKFKQMLLPMTAILPLALPAQEQANRPNIMLIVVDDMGYSDPGCFGGEVETPNLDGLAEKGIRLTSFYNSGRSCPSRASLLTGLYAQQVGITGMGLSLNNECVTIPEVLRQAGYHTAMSGKWHLSLTQGIGNNSDQMAWLSHQNTFNNRPFAPVETYPCNRGFEEHWGTIWGVVNHFDPFSLVHNEEALYTDAIPEDFYSSDFITEKAIGMIDDLSKESEPFFMYVSYNAPHWPLHAKPEDIAKYKGKFDDGWDAMRERRYNRMVELGLIDPAQTPNAKNESGRPWESEANKEMQAANMEVHAAMIDCVDQGIGKIIAKLKETGEYDNTIIVFTSDNGASSENYNIGDFDRHDRTRNGQMVTHNAQVPGDELTYNYLGTGWGGAVNTPFRYWKRESFHGGTAAPTIISWPEGLKAQAGSIVHDPCHFIDIMPTCIELAGATYPETYNGHKIQPLVAEGRSLMPIIEGSHWNDERTLFWEHETGRAVRVGDWKLTSLCGGGWQLFDMANDYSETNNVAIEHPDKVAELKSLWNDWARGVGLSVKDDIPDTDKELVFHYTFDGTLDDASGNGYNNLKDERGAGFDYAEGKYGQALKLNGNGQCLDLRVPNLIKADQTQFTLCMWVYDDETALPVISDGTFQDGSYFRDQVLVAQHDNAGTGRILLYTRLETPKGSDDTNFYYVNFLGNKHNRSTAGAFKRGEWQHVAVVSNPVDQSITFYINGKRDCTVAGSNFEPNVGGLRIGGHKANKDYWNGKIDDVYLYRGILTPEEICNIRDNGSSSGIENITDEQASGISYDPVDRVIKTSDGKTAKNLTLYSTSGVMLKSVCGKSSMQVPELTAGLYVAMLTDGDGAVHASKIMLN